MALAGMLLLGAGAHHVWRTNLRRPEGPARRLVSIIGMLMVALFVLMVIGTAIPPLVLHPCD